MSFKEEIKELDRRNSTLEEALLDAVSTAACEFDLPWSYCRMHPDALRCFAQRVSYTTRQPVRFAGGRMQMVTESYTLDILPDDRLERETAVIVDARGNVRILVRLPV